MFRMLCITHTHTHTHTCLTVQLMLIESSWRKTLLRVQTTSMLVGSRYVG